MLNLDYRSIVNWREVCYTPNPNAEQSGIDVIENPFNAAMGLMLMHTGMQSITHANAWQFFVRSQLVAACTGAPFINGDGTPRYITVKDVYAYIGLTSNCSRRTEAWFYRHLRENLVPALKSQYLFYTEQREAAIRERILPLLDRD